MTILFGDPAAAQEAAEALSANGNWPAVLQMAMGWCVSSQLTDAIGALDCHPPKQEWRDFRRTMILTFAVSSSRAAKGVAALRQLSQAGIPAAAFKGLASAARLYRSAGKRTIKDADLLVNRRDLEAALESLAAIGFVPLEAHKIDRLESFLENSPGFSGNKAIVLYGAEGHEIDLHWSVGEGLDTAALLARSQEVTLFETAVRIVAPEDRIVLTARHAVRENLTIDMIGRDLFDIRLSYDLMDRQGTLVAACNSVTGSSLIGLLAMTGILQALHYGEGGVKKAHAILAARASKKDRRIAAQLNDVFFYQVREGALSKDLLYLTHSRPVLQILAGAWLNWSEYRDLMRSLEEKSQGAEVPIGRRLRMLATNVRKTGLAQFRAIRALARLKFAP